MRSNSTTAAAEQSISLADPLRCLLEGHGFSLIWLDRDGRVSDANAAAEQLLGFKTGQLTGRKVDEIFSPTDLHAYHSAQLPAHAFNTRLGKRSGDFVPVSLCCSAKGDGALVLAATPRRDTDHPNFDELPAGLMRYHATLDGRLIDFSNRFCEMLGYRRTDLLGRHLREITHPNDRVGSERLLAMLLDAHQATVESEQRYLRRDGRPIWACVSRTVVSDRGGEPLYVMVYVQNITAQRRAETAARFAERTVARQLARFRAIFERSPVGVIIGDGRRVNWNPAALAMHGFQDRAEARDVIEGGRCPFDLFTGTGEPLDRSDWPMARALRGEAMEEIECRIERPQRQFSRMLSYSATPVQLEGKLAFGLVTVRDLTTVRQIELDLKRRKCELDALLAMLPVPVVLYREDRNEVVTLNPAGASTLLGLDTAARVCSLSLGELQSCEVRDRSGERVSPLEFPVLRAAREHHSLIGDEYQITRPDDTTRHLLCHAVPLRDQGGQVYGALGAFIDITERRELEQRTLETNRQLIEINRELEQFAYVAAHDLKAPLRAIFQLSESIEEDELEGLKPEMKRRLRLLRGRAVRMHTLIEGLLAYAQLGQERSRIEPVSVAAIMDSVIESLGLPPEFQIVVEGELPHVETDPVHLGMVLQHLIDNAVRHHDGESGIIWISGQPEGAWVRFTIADDGPGIDAVYREKVFQIFQTLKARDRTENTGVGLSVARKLVERYGGAIRIEDNEPRGVRLIFTWPAAGIVRQTLRL